MLLSSCSGNDFAIEIAGDGVDDRVGAMLCEETKDRSGLVQLRRVCSVGRYRGFRSFRTSEKVLSNVLTILTVITIGFTVIGSSRSAVGIGAATKAVPT